MESWFTEPKIPLGRWVKIGITWLQDNAAGFSDAVTAVIDFLVDGFTAILLHIPFLVVVFALAALRHRLGPSAMALRFITAVARPDADASDVRLPDSDPGPISSRFSAGLDLHGHFLHRGAGPPDLSRYRLGADAAEGSRRGVRRDEAAVVMESRIALRAADHHGRRHPVHYAELVDGRRRGFSSAQRGFGVPVGARARNVSTSQSASRLACSIVLLAIVLDRVFRNPERKRKRVRCPQLFRQCRRCVRRQASRSAQRSSIAARRATRSSNRPRSRSRARPASISRSSPAKICVLIGTLRIRQVDNPCAPVNGLDKVARGQRFSVRDQGVEPSNVAHCQRRRNFRMLRTSRRIAIVLQRFALLPSRNGRKENVAFRTSSFAACRRRRSIGLSPTSSPWWA